MKLLIGGKSRNIYFRKDNTAYYKSNGNENDITHYFKKTGGLKKQYSNLLVENNKVLKNRKIIIGGASSIIPIFNNITIELEADAGKTEWTDEQNLLVYRGLVQLCLLTKIECDNNNGNVKMLTDPDMPIVNKDRFIILLEIIFGCYGDNMDLNMKLQPINGTDVFLQAIAKRDFSILFTEIKENYKDSNEKIKELFNNISYDVIAVILTMIFNAINSDNPKLVKNLVSNLSKLKELMTNAGFLENPEKSFWDPYPPKKVEAVVEAVVGEGEKVEAVVGEGEKVEGVVEAVVGEGEGEGE
tara:strand:+ start:654 stop:1553 length:900 start_codon:yes stop_codon:yes gene_type:complete